MTEQSSATLDTSDIQGIILRERPTPYVGAYLLLRIDDASDGRRLLQALLPHVTPAARWQHPNDGAWLNLGLTHPGLQRLGLPQVSLDSFAPEMRAGMAARAAVLCDTGDSAPANWQPPLGSGDVHVALALFASTAPQLQSVLAAAHATEQSLPGVALVFQQDVGMLPNGRTQLGYHDGISNPVVEGSGQDPAPGEQVIKAGEFLFGYPDETGVVVPMPQPAVLGHNGSYFAFRKLHMRVAAFRSYLRSVAASPEEEALLAAKIVGRWPDGAPLMLAPTQDDPALGDDPARRSAFAYMAEDPKGLRCPIGAHIRRANPRDQLDDTVVDVSTHRLLRRGAAYGPPLPEGVLDDDGVDRGIVFSWLGASLARQFEFIKSQWLEDSIFNGLGDEKDPLTGSNNGSGTFTIPQRPVRRRLRDLPDFAITRGGEYGFFPSLRALRWLAEGDYTQS